MSNPKKYSLDFIVHFTETWVDKSINQTTTINAIIFRRSGAYEKMDTEVPVLSGTLIVSPQSSFTSFNRISKKVSEKGFPYFCINKNLTNEY